MHIQEEEEEEEKGMVMAYPHYRSQFGDTTFTKVFVGGLAWETPTEEMREYFQQFGDILEAVIITDKNTGKSKGYGFVTFRDPESARRACENPNPMIDGRRANCNIASLGRPRPSPPRGRIQGGGNPYRGGAPSYRGVAAPLHPPLPPPPPPPVIYPPYGYPSYSPADYGYHQMQGGVYNPQFYQQMYGTPSSTLMGSPHYYGYSIQSSPRGTYSTPPQPQPRIAAAGPSYLYYPTQMDGSFPTTYPPPPPLQLPRPPLPFSSDSQTTPQHTPAETDQGRAVSSESPNV